MSLSPIRQRRNGSWSAPADTVDASEIWQTHKVSAPSNRWFSRRISDPINMIMSNFHWDQPIPTSQHPLSHPIGKTSQQKLSNDELLKNSLFKLMASRTCLRKLWSCLMLRCFFKAWLHDSVFWRPLKRYTFQKCLLSGFGVKKYTETGTRTSGSFMFISLSHMSKNSGEIHIQPSPTLPQAPAWYSSHGPGLLSWLLQISASIQDTNKGICWIFRLSHLATGGHLSLRLQYLKYIHSFS